MFELREGSHLPNARTGNVEMSTCVLHDRAVVAVSGDDAEEFLNRLLTNSMLAMRPGEARYAALLSPQGKLLFDFIVVRQPEAFWIDCRRDQAADLARRLAMFKLRAKVVIADRSADLAVAAHWGDAPADAPGLTFDDPRHDALGQRIIAPADALRGFEGDAETYRAHRISLGVPEGGVDFTYGDAFVHDANLDLLRGVDFDKGCYVGQEVVSRVHHRRSARKRIVKVHFYGDPAPRGAELMAGPLRIGEITSRADHDALAWARIDRLAEAEAASVPVTANETLVAVTWPAAGTADASFRAPTTP